jgi:hypothetical protein
MVNPWSLFINCKVASEFDPRGNNVALVTQIMINEVVSIKVDVLLFAYPLYFGKRNRFAVNMKYLQLILLDKIASFY